jgi:hypothetical protein
MTHRHKEKQHMHQKFKSFHYKPLMLSIALGLTSFSTLAAVQPAPQQIDHYQGHARVFVLTDMGNEPDDQMSMVRLLTYSNELDLEGLIATTSTWQRAKRETGTMNGIIKAYDEVRPNLLKHAKGWPTADYLEKIVSVGQPDYGMADVGQGKSSPGSKALIAAVDRNDPRPVWVTVWGGANTLAQALYDVRATRSADQLKAFEAKLRVYSISDQDDAGPWIRKEFPDVTYIVKPSSPDGGEYASATWTGIAGDEYYKNGDGADFSQVTNAWLDKNIRAKGPLGKHYLKYAFIMEGDTPSYLGLTDNGLNSNKNPSWGGWGGRYVFRQPYGETHAIWTQGGDWFGRVTSADTVKGADGQEHTSDQATIWRWRNQFQNDFAARMDWTIKSFAQANHHPVAVVNGEGGKDVLYIKAKPGDRVVLDASQSSDPDKNKLSYHWFHYREAGYSGEVGKPGLADVTVTAANTSKTTIQVNKACREGWLADPRATRSSGVAHIILEVTDHGTPQLTSYRRVIIQVDAQK